MTLSYYKDRNLRFRALGKSVEWLKTHFVVSIRPQQTKMEECVFCGNRTRLPDQTCSTSQEHLTWRSVLAMTCFFSLVEYIVNLQSLQARLCLAPSFLFQKSTNVRCMRPFIAFWLEIRLRGKPDQYLECRMVQDAAIADWQFYLDCL